jgi:hypothetical protein
LGGEAWWTSCFSDDDKFQLSLRRSGEVEPAQQQQQKQRWSILAAGEGETATRWLLSSISIGIGRGSVVILGTPSSSPATNLHDDGMAPIGGGSIPSGSIDRNVMTAGFYDQHTGEARSVKRILGPPCRIDAEATFFLCRDGVFCCTLTNRKETCLPGGTRGRTGTTWRTRRCWVAASPPLRFYVRFPFVVDDDDDDDDDARDDGNSFTRRRRRRHPRDNPAGGTKRLAPASPFGVAAAPSIRVAAAVDGRRRRRRRRQGWGGVQFILGSSSINSNSNIGLTKAACPRLSAPIPAGIGTAAGFHERCAWAGRV